MKPECGEEADYTTWYPFGGCGKAVVLGQDSVRYRVKAPANADHASSLRQTGETGTGDTECFKLSRPNDTGSSNVIQGPGCGLNGHAAI